MPKIPATYLALRAMFVLKEITFGDVADAVNRQHGLRTTPQYVRNALRMYWGRKDLRISGVIAPLILAKTRELLLKNSGNGAADATKGNPAPIGEKTDESRPATPAHE